MKNFIIFTCLTQLLMTSSPCHSKDFGVHGATYDIAEKSLLQVIESRLSSLEKSGKLQDHQKEISKYVEQRVQRPNPVPGLSRTQEPRSYKYDPTLTVEEDIKDHRGNLIAQKGSQINPLTFVSWGVPLLLIDGDDTEQLEWAAKTEDKLTLVKGAPIQLEKQLNRPVYFDQGGRIVKKFGIRHVPCRISQAGDKLLVEELEPIILRSKSR